jgi:NADH-quinone oxidoreductase subunit I
MQGGLCPPLKVGGQSPPYEITMKDSDILNLEEPHLSLADQFYLPQVLIGLGTTMKHMLKVLGGTDRVIQYPEERREDMKPEDGGMLLQTYRGVHRLNKDEEGRPKCVACFMCSTACPARCIHIEAAESPWDDREKYPQKFDIDELRCIYCGMCEEACPCDAIELTHEYDIVGLTRQEMIFDKSKLLKIYDETVKDEPM